MLQRNIRHWLEMRVWAWFKLYANVRPLLQAGKEQEELDKLSETVVVSGSDAILSS